MRTVDVPFEAMAAYLAQHATGFEGKALVVVVNVNWPELALTDEQRAANHAAAAFGQHEPWPDPQTFKVVIPWVPLPEGAKPMRVQ